MHKIRILLIICFILFATLLIKAVNGFRMLNRVAKNQLPSTYILPKEHYDILSHKYVKNITVNEVIRTKLRAPITLCDYDSLYNLIIYKIDLENDSAYAFSTKEDSWETDETVGIPYQNIDNKQFTLHIRADKRPDSTKKVILSYTGILVSRSISNDSIQYIRLHNAKLSLRYKNDEPIDILLEPKKNQDLDVLLARKNKSLFFLAAIPDYPKHTIPDSLLYKIVIDK